MGYEGPVQYPTWQRRWNDPTGWTRFPHASPRKIRPRAMRTKGMLEVTPLARFCMIGTPAQLIAPNIFWYAIVARIEFTKETPNNQIESGNTWRFPLVSRFQNFSWPIHVIALGKPLVQWGSCGAREMENAVSKMIPLDKVVFTPCNPIQVKGTPRVWKE